MVLIPTRPTPADLWSLGATIDLLFKTGVPFAFIFTQAKDIKVHSADGGALFEFGSCAMTNQKAKGYPGSALSSRP